MIKKFMRKGALFATGAGGGQQRPPSDEEAAPQGTEAPQSPAEEAEQTDEKK
jgi:hypothetical protein